ncbi:MAG: hypothetical protein PHN38_08450 [Sulfurospirillaceae bacterium]|nr:hypothetical protein [Sulfurospirillaceae bacterium]MDD3462769.1 hypothetical protein [Sulfurospirillaceae bacterium]
MEITQILGYIGFALIYFISLYYVGLNHWIVIEHNKIYKEFDAIKAEIAQLKKTA